MRHFVSSREDGNQLLAVFLFIVILLAGCSHDNGVNPNPGVVDTTNISGTVSEASIQAGQVTGLITTVIPATSKCSSIQRIVGAAGAITDERVEVSAGGKSVLTDANGFYHLQDVPVPEDGRLVVTFRHLDGLFAKWQKAIQVIETEHHISAILEHVHVYEQPIPTDGKIESAGQGDITFPPEMAGQKATVYFGDPTGNGAATFPGDYLAKVDRSEESLMSIAFAEITVTDTMGALVTQLPSPATVNLRLPESFQNGTIKNPVTNAPYKAGDTIAWWSYNESLALWEIADAFPSDDTKYDADVVAGTDGLYIRAQITHLSWWNGDTLLERAGLNVRVVDGNGNPLANVLIDAQGVSYSGRYFSTFTDATGWARNIYVKRSSQNQETVKMTVCYGDLKFVYDVTNPEEGDVENNYIYAPMQPASEGSQNLGNTIRISLEGKVFGIVSDSSGIPQPAQAIYSNFDQLATTDSNGRYSLNVPLNIPLELYLPGYSKRVLTVTDDTPVEVNWTLNQAPKVKLTNPTPNQIFAPSSNITIEAYAIDDDTITQVEFYNGNALLGTDNSDPYSYVWNNVPAGEYFLRAVATDQHGIQGYAQNVRILVNEPPTVVITSPNPGAIYEAPASISLAANASDNGILSGVYFQANDIWIGSAWTAPYNFSWANVPPGIYTLTAVAKDNDGAMTTSAPITVTVNGTVAITSPQNGATFPAPVDITIEATVVASNISKVDFYQGTTLLGTDTSSPYSYTWPNVQAGTYALKAIATDSIGAIKESLVVNITVGTVPAVNITSPSQGQNFTSPAAIAMSATASIAMGNITQVAFYEGSNLLYTDTSSPYEYTWNKTEVGTYDLKAVATAGNGTTGISPVVQISVVNSPPGVNLISPIQGATFTAPVKILLSATAADSNRTVTKVDFYAGNNFLGTASTSPYSFLWHCTQAGNYGLKAVATDNEGAIGESLVVTTTVRTPAGPLEGGVVHCLQIAPSNPDILYAGTYAGVFKSTNAGDTWIKVNNGITLSMILSLAIDPTNANIVYAGTEKKLIFKTIDGGNTWIPIDNFPLADRIVALAIHPVNTNIVYACTDDKGIFRSINAGSTWTPIINGLPPAIELASFAIDPNNPTTVYIGTDYQRPGERMIYKSTDGGDNWIQSDNGIPADGRIDSIAMSADESNIVYAISENIGVAKSVDSGANWQMINNNLPPNVEFYALAVDPSDSSIVYIAVKTEDDAAIKAVYKTINAGTSWTVMSTGLPQAYSALSLVIHPNNPSILYATSEGDGVYKTTNAGNSWAAKNSGLTGVTIQGLCVDPNTPSTLYAASCGGSCILKSTDSGATWTTIKSGVYPNADMSGLAIHPSNSNIVYATTWYPAEVYKSTNGGVSWLASGTGLPGNGVFMLAIAPNNPAVLYVMTDEDGVYKSIDSGLSWFAANNGLPGDQEGKGIVIDPTTPSIIYCTGDQGVYKSLNDGNSWTACNNGIAGAEVSSIVMAPDVPSTLYVGVENTGGIFKSVDSGASWNASGLSAIGVYCLAVDPQAPSTLYAGTHLGLFKSTDAGNSWVMITSLVYTAVASVAIDPVNTSNVYAGTGSGIYKINPDEVSPIPLSLEKGE